MKNSRFMPAFLQRLSWLPLRALFSVYGSLEVRGSEHLRALRGPAVFASNHVSEFDPLLIVSCLPFFSRHIPLVFVSREKSFYKVNWRSVLYGGTFFRMMGAYPAQVGLNDYPAALRLHIEALKDGGSVCIFPMGGIRPRDGEPFTPKSGASFLARHVGVPVLPVRIDGLDRVTAKEFYGGKRHITVTFGAPIAQEELFANVAARRGAETKADYEGASSVLMEKIRQLA